MREVITTGKTVEEATELALAQLGLSAEEVMVEVIDLPQKKLFKSIPAKVKVTADDGEMDAPEAEAPKAPAPKAAQPAQAQQPAAKAPAQPAKEHGEEFVAVEETPIDLAENEKARDAVEYLSDVCAKMGAQGLTITPVQQGEATVLKVEGEDAGALIGHRGEVMEALSYLTSLVANRTGGDYMKIGLDINHYRSKREANLVALAKRIGTKVARTGRGHTLEPMNPYERRIIHSTISEIEGVKSESIGDGAGRRVVISSTDPNARPPRENHTGPNRGGRGPGFDRGPRRDGKGPYGGGQNRGSRREGDRPDRGPRTSSTPGREFADRPRDPDAAPIVPQRTETINDGGDMPLYGKIEL